jgi:hypothetical protein
MLKIRTYPHFDPALTEADAQALVTNPHLVATHAFHPFIEFSEGWTKYAAKGCRGIVKSRPIKYASRRDSCIYSHYRSLLSAAYETELLKQNIEAAVLAYRCIPRVGTRGNKSNVHFADDAFSTIAELGNCLVYTLDISKFFESISHIVLKRRWAELMGFKALPPDHYKVFRSVTRYATVRRDDLYRALGFIGPKYVKGRQTTGYLVNRVPLQVCRSKEFRKKVTPLITTNPHDYGIPQGSPISDVLANLYLIEFDVAIKSQMTTLGGSYLRYSDDILLIIPGHNDDVSARLKLVEDLLGKCGANLNIQTKKSTVHKFTKSASGVQVCQHLLGTAGKNGLEYLGFRFDGRHVFIRDSTRSRLQRKMTFAVNATVRKLIDGNPGMGRASLKSLFDAASVLRQFYKVRDFETVAKNPRDWTFWTYVIRAQRAFANKGKPIGRQVRNFRRSISHKASRTIDKYISVP